jgi:phage terminase small subunit
MQETQAEKLTDRQERFCREYLVDLNATQAAKRAGYSSHTANEQAARLLAKASVKVRVTELQNEAAKRNDVTVDDVLAMLLQSYKNATAANQHGPAVRAVELLGKRRGMFKDKVELSEVQALSDDALIAYLAGGDEKKAAMLREMLGSEDEYTQQPDRAFQVGV